MKQILLILSLLFVIWFSSFGQILDSIKYDNGFLYYHEYGKGETIILLTGGPGNNCVQLAEMASVLSGDHRIILLEQRGTGLSIPTPFDSTTINTASAVSDIKLLLDKLHLKQAVLCGHSWGASLAMYFASIHPEKVKSLILIDPGNYSLGDEIFHTYDYTILTRWSINEKKMIDSLTAKREKNIITNEQLYVLKYMIRLAYISNKEKIDSLFKKIDAPVNQKMQSLMDNDASKSKIDFRQSLKKLNKPVYIICGRQDIFSYVSYELKIANPNFELFWIQNCGHFPMYEKPAIFYPILNKILSTLK